MKKLAYIASTLMLSVTLAACGSNNTTADPNNPNSAVTQPTADSDEAAREGGQAGSVTNVDDDAENFYGKSVTVQGDVVKIYNETMFRIEDPSIFGGDDVLVILPQGAMAPTEGQRVEVSGMVQQYDQSEIEQALNIDLDDALGTELDGQPVIVADNVNG